MCDRKESWVERKLCEKNESWVERKLCVIRRNHGLRGNCV